MTDTATPTTHATPFTTERHRFDSNGDTLVADLFRPFTATAGAPIVIVTGSWTTSKEQQANFYARQLAANGITALTFDFRGFGQSGGGPRDWENPTRKIADIHAAVGFARTIEGTDPDRIGALGVCASSGYQAVNAASDHRVRSLGMIAPWLHNTDLVAPYYGGPDGVADRIELSKQAEATWRETGEVRMIPAISETDESAAMFGPFDYYLDPARGLIPEWDQQIATMSWQPWLEFDPIAAAPNIDVPVQMVHSRDGAVPDGAQAFYDGLAGPKSLIWIDGGQLDFYDQPAQVAVATPAIVDHFDATL
ncbi:MAG: alpha/beta fold hydrolase [Ilumatobacter sp.]|uniref:alpha/beta hydrolase n=1 Tax=Ilumatobacter sp. TaxID=1967498 RepID=UPI00262EA454|nr:alpha/beta fold hydrolase [Ilumatobacter sp.]MDJ0770120.1 alpha/beta fold hydrolase [Ilumatobacter sp.]